MTSPEMLVVETLIHHGLVRGHRATLPKIAAALDELEQLTIGDPREVPLWHEVTARYGDPWHFSVPDPVERVHVVAEDAVRGGQHGTDRIGVVLLLLAEGETRSAKEVLDLWETATHLT